MGIGWRYCSVMLIPLGILAASGAGGGGSYQSIASITASGGETSLTFNSIPSTYKHLQLRAMLRKNATTILNFGFRLNNDSTSIYTVHYLYGDGSTVGASNILNYNTYVGTDAGGATNTFGVVIVDILDYTDTSKYRTIREFGGYDNNGTGKVQLTSGLYRSTTAVSRLDVYFQGDALGAGSTFALYGIKGA